ncbi:hypothetical protein [Flavobacterium sp.]|uniref:hypothetical protein n=1 Tax=Flavobacterium sp. TaxID=239 RepID=UPI0012030E77|nr:hypothetical protein [Flavobacterium sp.]RZJ70553.1 MAG: hypothetical protein EOO49_13050 [Flavobacterium sp.]
MKKLILFSLISLLFISCKDDDTQETCNSNCTTIQGRFRTMGDEPLANVRVKLDYRRSLNPGAQTRRIVNVKSDSQGDFQKDFYIQDDELGAQSGIFRLNIEDSHLSDDLYIKIGELGYDEGIFPSIGTRDTTLNLNFYIPKKAIIKVRLNNFVPLLAGDYFEVQTRFDSGYEISPGIFQQKTLARDEPNTQQNQFYTDVIVSQGAENTVLITKRKNGVVTLDEYPISVPAGSNNIELTYEY